MTYPLQRCVYEASKLIKDHPPKWSGRNKLAVFKIACSIPYPFAGQVVYARWPEEIVPAQIVGRSRSFSLQKGIFEYPESDSHSVVWHVNFADPELFVAYSSSLLAQDELLVAEHPILGSLKESLDESGVRPLTIADDRRSTPVTITGVQRRCAINTSPTPSRPRGLYGNEFVRASEQEVESATRAIKPPTLSNILAMSAPACGQGIYTIAQLTYILKAAFTGFSAAKRESVDIGSAASKVVIHTGFWGCGAFGGNRIVMTILQSLAADLAGVDLVFWSFDSRGLEDAEKARGLYLQMLTETRDARVVLQRVRKMRLEWGVSDGN